MRCFPIWPRFTLDKQVGQLINSPEAETLKFGNFLISANSSVMTWSMTSRFESFLVLFLGVDAGTDADASSDAFDIDRLKWSSDERCLANASLLDNDLSQVLQKKGDLSPTSSLLLSKKLLQTNFYIQIICFQQSHGASRSTSNTGS